MVLYGRAAVARDSGKIHTWDMGYCIQFFNGLTKEMLDWRFIHSSLDTK